MSARRRCAELSTSTASAKPTASESANPSSVARSVGSVLSQRSPRLSQVTESTRLGAGQDVVADAADARVELPDGDQGADDQERRQAGERPAARAGHPSVRGQVCGREVRRVIGRARELLAVGVREHAGLEEEAHVALPHAQRLRADPAGGVLVVALGHQGGALVDELAAASALRVGVDQDAPRRRAGGRRRTGSRASWRPGSGGRASGWARRYLPLEAISAEYSGGTP